MDDLFPVLMIVVLVVLIARFMAWAERTSRQEHQRFLKELGEESSGQKKCPPHKWTYRDDGKMQCAHSTCRYVAGSDFQPRQ